jgi:hypothetical protein
MFDLKKFLTENKLTRNSILLEGDNAPAFTPKEMKNFNISNVSYEGETNNDLDPIINYQGHEYQLRFVEQDVEAWKQELIKTKRIELAEKKASIFKDFLSKL